MARAGDLKVGLQLESATFIRETRRVNDSIQQMGRTVDRTNALVARGFNAAASSAKAFGVGLVAAVGANSIAGLARVAKAALDAAGGMGELAAQTGVTTRDLQILQFAATQSGAEFGTLSSALSQFARRVGEAAAGNKQMAEDFQRMGLSLTNSEGQLRTSMELFEALADRVQEAGSTQEQMRIATEALGRSGGQLLPILQGGAEAVREFGEKMEAAGLIMSGQMIAKADQTSDAMAVLQFAFQRGFEIGVVRSFNLELNTTVDRLTTVREIGEAAGLAVGNMLEGLVAFAQTTIREWEALKEILGDISFDLPGFEFFSPAGAAGIEESADALNSLGTAAGGVAPPLDDAAKAMATMLADADRENQQLTQLMLAYQGLGSSVEDVTDAMKIDDQLRAAKITRLKAEESGLLEVLVANERVSREIQRLADVNATILAQRQKVHERFVEIAERKGNETLTSGLVRSVTEDQDKLEEALSDPFKNALEDIQSMFTNTFDEVAHGTIRSFEDMANQINDIFVRLSANIATLSLSPRAEDQEAFAKMAQSVGLTGGQLQALAFAPAAIGTTVGLFGNQGARQGMGIGGGIGGLAGAGIGFMMGGPAGAMLGGLIGQTAGMGLGALFGGLFGGGGPKSNKVAFGPEPLGSIQGTGQGAAFVMGLDESIMGFLTARQEQIANAMLAGAPRVAVQFSKEMSWNDRSNVARSRIAPIAQSLGLNADLIAGQRQQFSAEKQQQNLQMAIELQKTIARFNMGPIAAEFDKLNEVFGEMHANATRLGLSGAKIIEMHKREEQALARRLRMEIHDVMLAVGATNEFNYAIMQLQVFFEEAEAKARELGISTANLTKEHERQIELLVQQERKRRHGILETIGLINNFERRIGDLHADYQMARIEAQKLGFSMAEFDKAYKRHLDAIRREWEQHIDDLARSIVEPFRQMLEPLQFQEQDLSYMLLNPLQQFQKSGEDFHDIARRALAGDLNAIAQFEDASRRYIEEAGKSGASVAQSAAIGEVLEYNRQLQDVIINAQREASAGVEEAIRRGDQRKIDTLKELIAEQRLTREEIQRLRRQ